MLYSAKFGERRSFFEGIQSDNEPRVYEITLRNKGSEADESFKLVKNRV